MAATPLTVDDYATALPDLARQILTEVRRIIASVVPGVSESIRYQMPALPTDLETQIQPYRTTADTVRFLYDQPVPYDLIQRLVDVHGFLEALDHPRHADIHAVRSALLDAEPDLRERMKWNAPSFGFDGADDHITFGLQHGDRSDLIVHILRRFRPLPPRCCCARNDRPPSPTPRCHRTQPTRCRARRAHCSGTAHGSAEPSTSRCPQPRSLSSAGVG